MYIFFPFHKKNCIVEKCMRRKSSSSFTFRNASCKQFFFREGNAFMHNCSFLNIEFRNFFLLSVRREKEEKKNIIGVIGKRCVERIKSANKNHDSFEINVSYVASSPSLVEWPENSFIVYGQSNCYLRIIKHKFICNSLSLTPST